MVSPDGQSGYTVCSSSSGVSSPSHHACRQASVSSRALLSVPVCVSNQAAFVFRSAGQPHTIVVSSLFCAGKLFSARLEVKHGLQCEKRAKVCDFCFFVFFWVAFLEMVCMRLDFGPGRLWTVSRRILELRDTRVNCGWSKKLKRR